jgi:hypothetical protein
MIKLLLVCAVSALAVTDVPDNYKDLRFGSDTLKLRKQYPASEMQLFSLTRHADTVVAGFSTYTLVNKKGAVDSVRFYFLDNKLAMAAEYYFPGRDYLERAVKGVTAKYGQLVGQGRTYWRTRDRFMVRVGFLQKAEIATVSYMDTKLTGKMEKRLGSRASEEVKALDRELKNLSEELRRLDRKDAEEKRKGAAPAP